MDTSGLRVNRDSDTPLGAQLSSHLRELIDTGELAPGDRLPSIRELAVAAGVNVNTVRAVYARLEREGVARSEHGRGTYVEPPRPAGNAERSELRRQIAELEHELGRRPALAGVLPSPAPASSRGGTLLSTAELASIRDELAARLRELDLARADVLERLAALETAEAEDAAAAAPAAPRAERHSSPSVSVRVRWVGA